MIDRDDLIELLTEDDIINLMKQLGAILKENNENELIFSSICHHSDSFKLYYYKNSKSFMCYSSCGSMSLYDVIINTLDLNNDSEGFKESFNYVCNFKGITSNNSRKKGFKIQEIKDKDLDFLKLHKKVEKDIKIKDLPSFNENKLKIFDNYFPIEWEQDGIKKEVAKRYEIKTYFSQMQVIVPHRDIHGKLVGIRCRNFKNQLLDKGMKYIPIEIEGLTYKYPIGFNLYGIYQNQKNIKRTKKAFIFESEKSVMTFESFFGKENNNSLATCSMNFTKYQRDLLLYLGVNDLIVAYDKQYELDKLDYYTSKGIKDFSKEERIERKKKIGEYNNYLKKLIKIFNLTNGYMNLYIISCWDNRLDYKDSPVDKGIDTFKELYQERYLVKDISQLEEELIK